MLMNLRRTPLLALALVLVASACVPPRARAPAPALSAADNEQLLNAAEAELAQDDARDARTLLLGISAARLTAPQQLRLRLVQAEIALAEDHPVVALQALPAPGQVREPALAARVESDRAAALFRMGDAVGATQALVQRERLLPDEAQRAANRETLWQGLLQAELDTASGPRLEQADPATRGWIELAAISRSVWLDQRNLQARLQQWRAAYPGHPGTERIPAMLQPGEAAAARGLSALALLLPLSGPHAASAEAVRDGFFAAFYDTPDPAGLRPVVRVYDTGTTPDALRAAYRAALDEGAEFLVGPLTREDVAALASEGRPAVPVLALNYLEPGRPAPFNFFQWGLAPEHEARQAAEHAIANQQYRAAALVPAGDWGERVLRAFRERLEALGGTVVASGTYAPEDRDYSAPIEALLGIDASEERHRSLKVALGGTLEFQPRRREDVDLVFVAARPDQARLLGPQLRFHRAGDLPIYATSMIYEGGAPAPDLNGLRFCDMPWMLAEDGALAARRSQLGTLFPSRPREYTRLLALGHDAYTLAQLIDGGRLQPGAFFPAASGTLSLREDGVIVRSLACAEIRNGELKPLDVSLTPPGR